MTPFCPHGYRCGNGCPTEYCRGWKAAVATLEATGADLLRDAIEEGEACTPR